jgi:hypothetical protein
MDASDASDDLADIEKQLTELMAMTDAAHQHLSTLTVSLATETFSFEDQPVATTAAMVKLLEEMSICAPLTVEYFLKGLNVYIISRGLVDRCDYEVYLNDILREGLQFEPGIVKVPYATLLSHIPLANK